MRVSIVQTVLALSSLAGASRVLTRDNGVLRRQAFDPSESTRPGRDCKDLGPTYVECVPQGSSRNALCIDPEAGETCCDNEWGCPAESFCLVEGLCCPDGLNPETCAAENNVDLPPDFGNTDEPTADPTEEPSAPGEPTGKPTSEPEEPEQPPTDDNPPVQGGASGNNAGILGAVVGLAAMAL